MPAVDHQQLTGIFGGTFDPIHHGHLRLVVELLEQMHFAEIKMLPCGRPALKPSSKAAAAHRLTMLGLALLQQDQITIDDRELKRDTVSFTYDSLAAIRAESGDKPLALIIGNDVIREFDQWHRWQELLSLAHIIIVSRPNYALPTTGRVATWLAEHMTDNKEDLYKKPCGKIMICSIPLLAISASDIRRRIADNLSIRYLVPDAVWEYISNEGIYI